MYVLLNHISLDNAIQVRLVSSAPNEAMLQLPSMTGRIGASLCVHAANSRDISNLTNQLQVALYR
jgi:hypothetical protein